MTSKGSPFGGQFLDFIELSTLLLRNVRETGTTASFRGLIPESSRERIYETFANLQLPRRQLQEFKDRCPKNIEHYLIFVGFDDSSTFLRNTISRRRRNVFEVATTRFYDTLCNFASSISGSLRKYSDFSIKVRSFRNF